MTRADGSLSFSVIVASRHRPSWLKRCLTAIGQLDHPAFEVVVVADGESLGSVNCAAFKTVRCDEANLSLSRNLGIGASAGDICAFIDDDAVPEPLWLWHLDKAFHETKADAVTGFVRGRNGISFQSTVHSVDAEAETHAEAWDGWEPSVPTLAEGRALKLIGTNMAVRRRVLQDVGGFDEAYRFFLEDADLSMRLARDGALLAVAPLAQVHHGFAASSRRSRLRAPLDLHDIGRSTAIYLRRHLGRAEKDILDRIVRRERNRLVRHMVSGTCEPRHVPLQLRQLQTGWSEGSGAALGDVTGQDTQPPAFLRFPARPAGHAVLSSRLRLRRRHILRQAKEIVANGGRASVFSFPLTPFRHHVRYLKSGVWLQTGGVYGRSDRSGPFFRWSMFSQRLKKEIDRVANVRGIDDTDIRKWWTSAREKRARLDSGDTR